MSFDVHRGEFFGIVGRNGSGKSTLLKIMASIYRPDRGRVRMAGRVAPFIELGVGFNPELTARENWSLNGVLLGLTRREAGADLDAVLDFAELRDFVELKVKNYSSGMMVRLAFSIMVQADADIMLIDEVLAVGDAAFAQKCMDVFYERRAAGRTIVLVTHDMSTVQSLCHRAMVLHDGELQYIGEPEDAALRYFRLNFAGPSQPTTAKPSRARPSRWRRRTINGRVVHARLLDEGGVPDRERSSRGLRSCWTSCSRPRGSSIEPVFVLHVLNADGVVVFGFSRIARRAARRGPAGAARRRDREPARARAATRSTAGSAGIARRGTWSVQGLRLIHFVVYGTAPRHGMVSLRNTVERHCPTQRPAHDARQLVELQRRARVPRRWVAAGGARGSCCT